MTATIALRQQPAYGRHRDGISLVEGTIHCNVMLVVFKPALTLFIQSIRVGKTGRSSDQYWGVDSRGSVSYAPKIYPNILTPYVIFYTRKSRSYPIKKIPSADLLNNITTNRKKKI